MLDSRQHTIKRSLGEDGGGRTGIRNLIFGFPSRISLLKRITLELNTIQVLWEESVFPIRSPIFLRGKGQGAEERYKLTPHKRQDAVFAWETLSSQQQDWLSVGLDQEPMR
jgi:hypothetical protein